MTLFSIHPPIPLFVIYFLVNPLLSSSPQSQTAVGGQRDVTLREDEFTVGDSTGEMTSLLTAELLHSRMSVTTDQYSSCFLPICLELSVCDKSR